MFMSYSVNLQSPMTVLFFKVVKFSSYTVINNCEFHHNLVKVVCGSSNSQVDPQTTVN